MNDKLQQLYNLYLENGILTDATSFETFSQANGNQIDALYNLGQENGLFVTTDLDTFSGAWDQQPEVTPIEPPVKKKEDTVSVSEDGSLVSPGAEEVTEETFTKEYVEPLPFELPSDDKPNILEEIGIDVKPFEEKSFTFDIEERARRSKMTPEQRRRREIELKPELQVMYPKGVPEEVVQMYIDTEDAEIKNKLNLLDAYNQAKISGGGEPMSTAEYVGGVQGVENIMVDEYGYRKIEDFRYPSKKSIIEEVTTTDILSPDYPLQRKEDIETVRKRVSPVSIEKKKEFVNDIIAIDNTMLGDYDVDPVSGNLINNSQLDFIDVLDDKSYDEREEEIEKNKFRNAFIKNNIPQELYQENKYKSLSYEDLIMLNARAIDNFKRSYGEQEWEEYQKISGNSNPSLIGTKYENQDISNSKIQDLVVIGDEDATVANLSKEFPLFDFEVTKASTFGIDLDQYGDYITISTKDNQGRVVNSIDIYLEEENNPVERIRGFMQGALLSRKDKAFLDKADSYYKDIDGIVGRSTQSISQYEKENFGKDPIKELQIYNEIVSNPKKFGDGNSPAMYGKDRSIGAVNVEQIESFLDKNKGNIAPEVIEMLRYKMAVSEGVYSEQLAQQGSWASAINTGLAKFIYGFSEGGTGLLMSLPKTGATNEETRQIKNDILDAIESAKERFAGTTAESMAVRPMSQKAADAIVDMIPSILFGGRVAKGLGLAGEVVGVGRKAKQLLATGSGFAPQTYGAISQELKDADIPEYQKGLLALPITLVEQMLEGISGITILNKGNFPIFMNVAIKTLKDLPKNASEKTIRAALRTNLKSRLTSLGGELATMSITEGATEGTQTISEDLFKRIYNTFYEKDVFKVPDLSTKEGVQRYVDALVESIELGMISGPVGGGGFRAVGSLQNGFKTRQENKTFKFLYDDLMNDADLTKRKVALDLELEEGQITQEKYDDAIDVLNNGKGLMSQIPEDLSTNSKREAFVLLRERQQIEEKIAGKNKELESDNVQRLKEIDFLLKNVGQTKQKTDAISEQETTPVDEDQQATDVQKVEEGVPTAEPQQTTVEETTTEQVEKAPLTEEQQEVVSLEEEIEGKITEGRELPGQEIVEETQEVTEEAPVDDRKLVYDEKKTRSKGQQLVINRAQRAIKAVSKILPDAKIVIHESSKDFKNVTGKDGSGALIDGTIHLNMDKANNRTIAHEVMHAVLIKKLGTESDIRKVTARMLESVKKGLVKGGGKVQITTTETIDGKEVKTTQDVTIEEYLDKFAENYEENMQNEEKVVELAGLLANNYTNLEVKEKGVIKRWIQKVFKPIAAKLGINLNEVTKTDKDIVDFLNVVSRKTTTGDVITDTETEVLTRVKEEAPVVEAAPTKKKINWTKKQSKPQGETTQKTKEVQAKIRDLVKRYEAGEITIEEYNKEADKIIPVKMKEVFVEPVTEQELMEGLKSKNTQTNSPIQEGTDVALRIDIPFMKRTGKASVTIHERKSSKDITGRVLSYRGAAVIEDVEFLVNPKQSLAFATDEKVHKSSNLGRMGGKLVNIGTTIQEQNENAKKLSQQAIDEGWTQVGINPAKHSYFYDRATGKPLKSADRVVQVGDLIYAENAKTTDIYDDQFIVKGKTDKAGKPLRFQKADIEVDKISTRFQSDFSDKVTKLSFVYDKNGERFNKLKKDGFITTDKKIQDYDGQIMFLHQPDGAFSGMIYKDGEILVEGSGGMYYPIKFHQDGFFWASTEDAAKSMARKLNESMDQNGGKLLMGLITAPSDKLLSSTTMSNAVMDFFSSKAFDKTFNLTENQLRVALRKAANQKLVQVDKKTGKKKTIGLNLNIPASATVEQIKSEIQEKLGHDNSSFKDRKFFATELIGNMADVINRSQASVDQFGKLFSEGIQNEYFKGITKTGKLKISKANMVQALSEMFTEPVLKSEGLRDKSGQVYAVLELDSKVKPVKSDKHKSYPFALKSVNKDAKVKLNVLEEGQLWGEVFEDPETNDIITKERLTNVLPTNAGVSTQGLRVNTSRIASQEVSEIADREQKSLIQIGRYYNANNQGFFPAQVNEFQLRRDLQAIGLDLKRAKNGAYYATRNGRKANIFPPSPSPYSRFQRAGIEINEPTVFNKKDTAEDIIRTARKKGYNDKSIRFYLLNRRKGEFNAKEVDALLKVDATLFDQLPESFAEVEGGAIAGLKLFEKIDKFRQKLMDQNNRIKKPFLEEKQIQELVKEKRKELKKQGLSKEEIREKLEAFEKRERANNKKRTKRLTLSEIMDKTIEFMEQQPEYKREADSYEVDVKARKKAGFDKGITKYRKGISTQQAKMQAELQETIGQKPTKEVAENLAKLKRNVKSWEKGQRDLQAIKNELKRLMRKHLPKEMYSRKEALDLIKAISDANKDNINVQIEKVQELIVKKTNQRLTKEALDLLNIVTQKKESGKLKGVKVSNEVRKRLESIRENVLDPKKLSETDGELLAEKNLMLTKQFNLINQQATLTQDDLNNLIDLQIAIALNQAQQLEMDNPYRIETMESAVDSLDRLIIGGRGALQVQLEQAHAEYQRQFAELWEQITGQKLDMSDPDIQDKIDARLKQEVSRKDREEGQKRFRRVLSMTYRLVGQGINNHEALFGLMDKINVMPGELAGGRIQEIVTQRVDEASIKYKGRTMEQEDIIKEKAKEIFGRRWKRKMKQFQAKTDNIFYLDLKQDRKPLSQNEMAYMYNQFKDPSLHPTFERMLGENYEQVMKELESNLDPELKQWADWMVDEYFPSVYDHYNETYKKIYRTDMPFNQNYAGRIFREGLDKNKPLDLLGNSPISQTSVAPASTMVRDEKATSNILPMDINNALLSYVQEMEYFAAYAEPIRDINKMFNNDNTSKFITKVYGKNVQKLIKDQIEKISGKGIKSAKQAAVINFLNNSFIYAKIALSPVVFIKQLTSIFTYANDIGYVNWALYGGSAALKTPIGMGKTWREITENSVYLQDRARGANIKRAIGNYYDSSNQLINNSFLDASQQALLYTTKAGDKLAIMLGGIPNYLYYKDQYRKKNPKATEQEVIDYAIKKFEKDTKQTQQSSDVQDRDYYQTSDGFMRAMNMFLTTPKQYLRKEIIALRNLRRLMSGKAARGTKFENVRQFVTYHFAMPMLFQWATIGFPLGDDWDEEDSSDMIRAAVLGNLNGVFVLGDILGSFADLIQGKPWAGEVNSIPLFIQTADVFKALKELGQKVNAKNPDTKKIQEAQYDVYAALGGLFGLPLDQINKAIKNFSKLKDEKDAKKIFLRVLNFSEYVVEGPKKDKKKKKSGAPEPPKAPKAPKPPGYTEPEKKDLAPIKAIIKGLTEY